MTDLVYVRDEWLKRAEVAQECAEELGKLASSLGRLVRSNYFGLGCVEGQALFDLLSMVLRSGTDTLEANATAALNLAAEAQSAISLLEGADGIGFRFN